MKILAISGSASSISTNGKLLFAIQKLLHKQHEVIVYEEINTFELFTPEKLQKGVPENIQAFKKLINEADAIILSTPEYTHNIPAVVKNMIEWCTASGEFAEKPIFPITFTPQEPRGKYAMESLLNSLKIMNARIVAELSLYRTDVVFEHEEIILPEDIQEMIFGVIEMM